MSQPSRAIPGNIMQPLDRPLKVSRSSPDLGLRGRVSQLFTKMVTTADSPLPPIPRRPVPQGSTSCPYPNTSPGHEEVMVVSGATEDTENVNAGTETRARKRLSKKPSKRFSAPPTPTNGTGCDIIAPIKKSRFSLAVPPRNTSNPLPSPSTTPPDEVTPPLKSILKNRNSIQSPQSIISPTSSKSSSRVSSLQSSRTSSSSSVSTAPSSIQQSTPPRISSQASRDYNPLDNYVPCMAPNCDQHYLPTTLGPTFYSAQAPYNLHRKRGLCPSHAYNELKHANAGCKQTYESMRQNARRKTLGQIASEFELYQKVYDEEREQNSRDLLRAQGRRVCGYGGPQVVRKRGEEEQWDWRYSLRPCTKKGCKRDMYSPYSAQLFNFYNKSRQSGLLPQTNLCIVCAKAEIQECGSLMKHKREELGDEEWTVWCEETMALRKREMDFWEKAQERVVREKGPSRKWVEEESEEKELVKGKQADTMREICVVM